MLASATCHGMVVRAWEIQLTTHAEYTVSNGHTPASVHGSRLASAPPSGQVSQTVRLAYARSSKQSRPTSRPEGMDGPATRPSRRLASEFGIARGGRAASVHVDAGDSNGYGARRAPV